MTTLKTAIIPLFVSLIPQACAQEAVANRFSFVCEDVGSGWRRCANAEVICYTRKTNPIASEIISCWPRRGWQQ